MCGSDGLSSSSSLLICGKSCRCQAENPLNALPSFTRPALYVVLILAGVVFIPEAREWASARVLESWVWLVAGASDVAQWVSMQYAEGQATGSTYAAAA